MMSVTTTRGLRPGSKFGRRSGLRAGPRLALGLGLLLLGSSVLSGCGRAPSRRYYTLSYPVPPQQFQKAQPYTVRFKDLAVRTTYRTKNVVFRPDVHEIRFYKRRRWSEPPKKMLSTLTRDHLVQSGLFANVVNGVGQTPPKYTFTGEVEVIEEIEAGGKRFARLAITYQLIDFESDAVVWSHRFDTRRPVGSGSTRGTARALSQILAIELQDTFERLSRHLQGLPPREQLTVDPMDMAEDVIGPDPSGPPIDDQQLLADDTSVPVGFGAVFVPAALNGNRESLVVVYKDGKPVAEGRGGHRIVMRPGRYTVFIGSGATTQQIQRKIHVADSLTTYVPMTWAGLRIDVVDNQFVPYRNQYELVRMDTREDFGIGFGADVQQGEKVLIWVLKPGLYKIIQSGGTYRDRTNFATVRLEAGRLSRFTLVIDPDSGDFLGAGEADPSRAIADEITSSGWVFRGVLGGDVLFNRTNQLAEQKGWSLEANLFFDGSARYTQDQHNWFTRFELAEGQFQPAGEDESFRNQADRLFFHTIYTYQLYKRFGPYARIGLETKLLPRHENFDAEVDLLEIDGTVVETGTKRIEIASNLQPTETKQGVGGNFRVLQNRRASLNLRMGLGMLQTMNDGVFSLSSPTNGATAEARQLVTRTPLESNFTYGMEGTVVGSANLLRALTLITELDALAPFSAGDRTIFTWRNRIGLRLSSFVSLVYRFNASQNPNIGDEVADVKTEHDVQLRFSYTLF